MLYAYLHKLGTGYLITLARTLLTSQPQNNDMSDQKVFTACRDATKTYWTTKFMLETQVSEAWATPDSMNEYSVDAPFIINDIDEIDA